MDIAAAAAPEPYTINVATRYLTLTHQKFTLTRLPAAPSPELEALLDHWDHAYSWRTAEAHLNASVAPHFRLSLTPQQRLHFFHAAHARATPVLLLGEGWEFTRLIPPLSQHAAVVAPDLPGMGWSDAAPAAAAAPALRTLMAALGYAHYVIHAAGPLGWAAARAVCRLSNPGEVLGVHTAGCPPVPVHASRPRWWVCHRHRRRRKRREARSDAETYALTDSPVGLLAWVLARLHAGGGAREWSHDEVLGVFMYFWTPGPAGYFALEQAAEEEAERDGGAWGGDTVALGVTGAGEEKWRPGELERGLRVVCWERTKGAPLGRWAAWEDPEVVAEGVLRFLELVEGKKI
ncbi:Alpha/Beta hydrolase protein [Geopyxis carbonaria]|nr:Alpha/Beta hydrolase protein [Geopyxis carbonaria]